MQLLLALALLLGAGGVTVASDAAVPGDALFPVDRAVEQVRIAFAGNEKKNELRLRFAEERVAEFEQIIDEEQENLDDDSDTSSDDTGVVLGLSRAEATVFTDQTVVEITFDAVPTVFATQVIERADVIAEIMSRYDVDETEVDALLVIEIEDRASTPADLELDDDSDDDDDVVHSNQRVERGLESALEYLAEVEALLGQSGVSYDLTALVDRINNEIDTLTGKVDINVKVSDRGASFIKVKDEDDGVESEVEIKETGGGNVIIKSRDGTEKVEIKIKKDGEVTTKIKPDNRGQGNNNDLFDDEDDDDMDDDSDEGLSEVEVKFVGTNVLVKVEFNDEKDEFVLETTDRDEIIAEVATRYEVTAEEVEVVIEFDDEDDDDMDDDSDDDDQDDDGADDDSDDSDDDSDDDDDASQSLEIEVEVEDGIATVKIEIDGDEDEFTLELTDQDEIIAEITEMYPTLEPADITAAMEFEVKD